MNLSYVYLYSSSFRTSFLLKEVSANLRKFLPLVDVDLRPFDLKKNLLDDNHKDSLMNRVLHSYSLGGDNSGLGESQNSSNYSCSKITIIDGFHLENLLYDNRRE